MFGFLKPTSFGSPNRFERLLRSNSSTNSDGDEPARITPARDEALTFGAFNRGALETGVARRTQRR